MKTQVLFQPTLFDWQTDDKELALIENRSGSFVDNMKIPIHRWFRYSAGFSADWVRYVIRKKKKISTLPMQVLDPFAGVGTTLIACNAEKVSSIGFEPHSFVQRVASIKLESPLASVPNVQKIINQFLKAVTDSNVLVKDNVPSLLKRCYTESALNKLFRLKHIYEQNFTRNKIANELIWLTITAILRQCSTAGTAQCQYILPNKEKSKVLDPFLAFKKRITEFMQDILHAQHNNWLCKGQILCTDARAPEYNKQDSIDFVITSPPYPNNYDYADAVRLEMTFWGMIDSWKDLHNAVRKNLIRSCSQHSASDKIELTEILANPLLDPIRTELTQACNSLAEIRLKKGGRKTYHTMAASYFLDIAQIFTQLRRLCKDGSEMCFVIGDSAPYGIYLDVDKWLGELAISAGFSSYSFEKIRDRNIKWKNRKHRVPLKEGRLWIQG
ncbi:MAG: DNA modification methylase [Candidatus Anammoxibacter sp.]